MAAPGNTHFHSNQSEVGPAGAAGEHWQLGFVSGMLSVDGDAKCRTGEGMCVPGRRE